MKRAKITLLRHGECEGGAIFRGQTDVALTATGVAQMQHALTQVTAPITHVFSSPLQRCFGFSLATAQALSVPLQALTALQEIDFGLWDGQSFERIYQQSPQAFDAYWRDPWASENTPEAGETLSDFNARVETGLMAITDALWLQVNNDAALNQQAELEPHALVVTHGGVMRCLMGYVLNAGQSSGLFANLALPYAAIMSLDVYWTDNVEAALQGHDNNPQFKVSFTLHWPQTAAMPVR